MSKGEGYVKKPSTGEYEGGLMCAECENKLLGGYEDYASKAIYGGPLHANESPVCQIYINQDNIKFSVCKNISYVKYKLFLLSILWRASISTRPMFSEISLGPHEEIIRKMLYEGDAGDVSDYPIFMLTFVGDKTVPKDLIGHPQKRRTKDGHVTNIFIISGTIYMYYVNSRRHKLPDLVIKDTIVPSNQMTMYHVPDGQGMDLILNFYGIKKPSH